MEKKYTIFISDIHLSNDETATAAIFTQLLGSEQLVHADALYILGDLFEAWLGDDDNCKFATMIKQCLNTLSQSCPIYVMHGNRDFLMGDTFAAQCNLQIIPDPTLIDLYGEQTLLMHGDTLCTDDTAYQTARAKFTSESFKFSVMKKPLWLRKLMAKYYRWKSRRHQKIIDIEITDVNQQAVIDVMRKYNVKHLIHGHTHRPAIHLIHDAGVSRKRTVLSDWHNHGHMLICFADGVQLLQEIASN